MAKTMDGLKICEVKGEQNLITEIRKSSGLGKALVICGDAGTGKTHIMNEVARIEKYDQFFEIRLAGIASEDK